MRKVLQFLVFLVAFSLASEAHAAFRSCGAVASGTSSSITINSPTGVQANDVVVLAVLYSASATITLPSGFTNVTNSPKQFNVVNENDTGYRVAISLRVATGSEPASYSASLSGSYSWLGVSCAFSGRNTSTPLTADATTSASGTASPVTVTLTGVTAAAADDLLWIPAFSKSGSAPTWTAPIGFTSQVSGDANNAGFNISTEDNVTAGATGNISGVETGLAIDQQGFVISLAAAGASSCAHSGWPSNGGAATVPNGTSGTYRLCSGALGTPDCSSICYIHSDGSVGVN